MLLGMFFCIWGAKLWVINRYGNSAPYLDQWHGEGTAIKAYVEGALSPAQFFEAHNEHRVAFTRLLSLLLICGNKQWDNILFFFDFGLVLVTLGAAGSLSYRWKAQTSDPLT
jgi:hypothetical protein